MVSNSLQPTLFYLSSLPEQSLAWPTLICDYLLSCVLLKFEHPLFLHPSPRLQYLVTYLSPVFGSKILEVQVTYLTGLYHYHFIQHQTKSRPLIHYAELAGRQDCFENVICLTCATIQALSWGVKKKGALFNKINKGFKKIIVHSLCLYDTK